MLLVMRYYANTGKHRRVCWSSAVIRVPQVEELRRDLRIKSQELEVKNAAANDKLKKMVKDQQEAEKKKARRAAQCISHMLLCW